MNVYKQCSCKYLEKNALNPFSDSLHGKSHSDKYSVVSYHYGVKFAT